MMDTRLLQQRWLDAMLVVASHYRLGVSEETVRIGLVWQEGAAEENLLFGMARRVGLSLRFLPTERAKLDAWNLPAVVELTDGMVCVMTSIDGSGRVTSTVSGEGGVRTILHIDALNEKVRRVAILRPLQSAPDIRVDDYVKPYQKSWFWGIALKEWPRYVDVMVASLVANLLALAGVLFSTQVYDRVIPAQSEATLWVLFSGVLLAIAFEFVLRLARARISDSTGKRADLKITDVVFGHALRIRNEARPRSTGSFIAQLRELEQVRELMTSTTVGAAADLPFFFLFLVVMWLVAGQLVFVTLAAVPLLVIPGLLVQRPLARLSNEGTRESALRNAMLVETVQGIEDIKLLRAEEKFQSQWNEVNAVSASVSMKQRSIVNLLMTWTQEVQSIVYAVMLLIGSFMVMKGDMTTGTLVGASLLSSRMISPLAQLSGVFARWQQAKVARKGLDELMERPVDQATHERLVHRPSIAGNYTLERVSFKYGKDDRAPTLTVPRLEIRAGEKIALLGRMGAGKSTLLQVLAGLRSPQEGDVILDGTQLRLIDPADVRRDMALLGQRAQLFYGTIRENLKLGAPMASDEMVAAAMQMVGVLPFVQSRPKGLDELILEGGASLSGGQRQSLLLARTLLCDSQIVLLDEPTSSFDEGSERHVIQSMKSWLGSRTLVIATHRMPVLELVDRIIVLDGGRVVMDGSKEQVIGALSR
ncbi:type I secretion system permease/ATPase [Paraburkholderia fynbosensis]|uniref:Cyclolysin secretion/processing ATP-binding protein CyaB n=1 Tax=Paraburkholderia fynbosensis TaxID=1200993 RepID=A0A6J5GCX1_9BURK|nr:type I secretion system permease/ATPase [Paraburkholderia fynbosensis]CAB3796614.1 Leukotoxin export ATP-binding protein LtxB [Paraburkholderia fynbosensis]